MKKVRIVQVSWDKTKRLVPWLIPSASFLPQQNMEQLHDIMSSISRMVVEQGEGVGKSLGVWVSNHTRMCVCVQSI